MPDPKKPTYEELERRLKALEHAAEKTDRLRYKLENVLKIARLGYFKYDTTRDLFTFNDHFYQLFNTTVDQVGGYTMSSGEYLRRFIHPDDISYVQWIMQKAKDADTATAAPVIEHRFLYADGTTGYLVLRHFREEIENGRVVEVNGLIQDITERREMEEQIRAITDSARDAILMMDPDGRISFWNPAARSLLGYNAEEALGQDLHSLLAPERFHESHQQAFPDFISYGKGDAVGKTLELNAIHRDGREIPVELSLSTVSLHGEWHAVGILRDITERKKAEEALREGEKRFRSLAEMLPEVVFECDMNLNFTYVNEQARTIFGYSKEDVEKGLKVFDILPPKEIERASDNIQKRMHGELTGAKEYLGLKKDGTIFPILLHAAPILVKGKPAGLRGIVVDITERKKIQAQLLQGQKMKSIGTLAGGIAHDFNNILQPILGYSEFLKTELPEGSNQLGYVEGIIKASHRAKELVKQILVFSRQSDQKNIPVRLGNVVSEAVKLSRSTIPANISIHQETPREQVYVMADPSQLHQITMNLIINAYHAVSQRDGEISVSLEKISLDKEIHGLSLQPGEYARLSVSDTGCGIDPAILDQIFEPYFTTKPIGKGSGLGLAVVYGIVKTNGGDIKVESELEKGTLFQVYLPRTTPPKESTAPETEERLPPGTERILMVDDEEMVVKVGSMMLERLGYKVTTHQSSREALATFQAAPDDFDLVITDMAMPEMTGDQLARELLGIRPEIPVIISTGYSERISRNEARAMGVRDFLMKPLSISEISKKLRAILDPASSQS